MKQLVGMMAGVLALVGCGYDPDTGRTGAAHEYNPPPDAGHEKKDEKDGGVEPPVTGLCRVTGGGQIRYGDSTGWDDRRPDSFGGNAAVRRGEPIGEWNHVTHDGEHFHAHTITSVECSVINDDEEPPSAGFDQIVFTGVGTFEGEECEFEVEIEDHGEGRNAPGRDEYQIRIYDCTGGVPDYETPAEQTILHGNLQIHPLPPGFL